MKIIIKNKRGLHNYQVIKRYEAGIELTGGEVKSIRNKKVQFSSSSYIYFKDNQVYLIGLEVENYSFNTNLNHNSKREKKLLMHKNEIKKMEHEKKTNGVTYVPSILYFNKKSLIKIEICQVKGLKKQDKREQKKKMDTKKLIKNYT